MSKPILAIDRWLTNAELVEDAWRLGYLRHDWLTLDPTYGQGVMWKQFRPDSLVAHDIEMDGVDFTALPYGPRYFDAVVFDPPYKLNGTPSAPDKRYGVGKKSSWQNRHALIRAGIEECARVCDKMLLIKCQDQVCAGKVRWQSREFADHAEAQGFELIDKFERLGYRAQPDGRRQVHARRNSSQLLVLRRAR